MTGGLSLQEALAHVSRDLAVTDPDLAVELAIVQKQSELNSLDQALEQFAQRIDAPEVTALTTLIIHGQHLGTDVVGSVRDFADNLREKWRQVADERANRVGVQMLIPLIFLLLPSVMIILAGPAVLEMVDFLQTFEVQSLDSLP